MVQAALANAITKGDLYAGLSDLDLPEEQFDLGEGILLRKSYAHLMSPYIVASRPAEKGKFHPGPWRPAVGGDGFDITAELKVPHSAAELYPVRLGLARSIVFLLRLWNPTITLRLLSNRPFRTLAEEGGKDACLIPFEVWPKTFPLSMEDESTVSNIAWVEDKWKTTSELVRSSREFRVAVTALDAGQFVPDTGLTLISLWAAMEAIFLSERAELSFRLSVFIASYLRPPGSGRAELRSRVQKLYGKRSRAAHGSSAHSEEDVLETFMLLREIIIKIVERGGVPTKKYLENLLMGAADWDQVP